VSLHLNNSLKWLNVVKTVIMLWRLRSLRRLKQVSKPTVFQVKENNLIQTESSGAVKKNS